MPKLLVGIGSNLGDRARAIDDALGHLADIQGLQLIRCSQVLASPPVGGPPDQPAFLNAAALAESELGPEHLVTRLGEIEQAMGRQRGLPWGPRTLDLDLLCYGNLVTGSSQLTVPHPWMCVRSFVLKPCQEIAPDFQHPILQRSLAALWQRLADPSRPVAIVAAPSVDRVELANLIRHVSRQSHWMAIHADGSEMPQLVESTGDRASGPMPPVAEGLRALIVFDRDQPPIRCDQAWQWLPEPLRQDRAPAVSLHFTDIADAESKLRVALAAITAVP